MTARRLSVCYAAPGQNLVPWAGPTRNVLNVAEALSQWADVTVAFRRVPSPVTQAAFQITAIEPGAASTPHDDNATRGLRPLDHLAYCRRLQTFARSHARSFDVVLEKGWRLSGWLSVACRRAGVPAVVVENDVRFWTESRSGVRQLSKYALHELSHSVATACMRRLPAIIAETDELKRTLVARRGLDPERIHVVELGVDHQLFRPMDQAAAREQHGIAADAYVMLYVGAMDEYHDLAPVIEGLASAAAPIELHVVGGGEYRDRYDDQARSAGIRCRFHGPVPYAEVPGFIAASDVCIAPYRQDALGQRALLFSTLKIPEYLACGRPVVSVPSRRTRSLVIDGVSGFIVQNDAPSWRGFLGAPPSRERLAAMRTDAAAAVASVTWASTAGRYLDISEHVISESGARTAAVADATSLVR